MTIRLIGLSMELATLVLWLWLVTNAKYQWPGARDDRLPFNLASVVIVLMSGAFMVTTATGLTNHRPITGATTTPIIVCMFALAAGAACGVVFYAKKISQVPRHFHVPTWHPEHISQHKVAKHDSN